MISVTDLALSDAHTADGERQIARQDFSAAGQVRRLGFPAQAASASGGASPQKLLLLPRDRQSVTHVTGILTIDVTRARERLIWENPSSPVTQHRRLAASHGSRDLFCRARK
jgi:hypothetical protein